MITFIIKCGMQLLIYSQASAVQPLKFVNGWLITSHIVLGMWFLIDAGLKANPVPPFPCVWLAEWFPCLSVQTYHKFGEATHYLTPSAWLTFGHTFVATHYGPPKSRLTFGHVLLNRNSNTPPTTVTNTSEGYDGMREMGTIMQTYSNTLTCLISFQSYPMLHWNAFLNT